MKESSEEKIKQILKSKINILNDLNDKINLIEWNKDDGPKFESVEEMKEFEKKVINGDFEFVLDDNTDTDNNTILKGVFPFAIISFIFIVIRIMINILLIYL